MSIPSGISAGGLGSSDGIDIEFVAEHMTPSLDVLRFYKSRVSSFEKERGDFLQRLASVESQNAELHRLRWEARSREEEIKALQSALSDAKIHLYDERETALTLAAENDSLKAQEIEDRQRIAHLLALTEPIAQEFTFFRDSRPMPPTTAATTSSSAVRQVSSSSAAAGAGVGRTGFAMRGGSGSSSSSSGEGGGGGTDQTTATAADKPTVRFGDSGRPLRTVVLGSTSSGTSSYSDKNNSNDVARTESLTLQVDSLRRQVGELRKLADDRAAAYARDRDGLRDTFARKSNADTATIHQLEQQLEVTQTKLTNLTKDYLMQRHTFSTNERELRELLAQSKAAQEEAERSLSAIQASAETEIGSLKTQLETATSLVNQQLQLKAAQHNDAVRMLKTKTKDREETLSAEVTTLKSELKKQKARYTALDKRRLGEMEGFQHDVGTLRRALRQLEAQWALVGGVVADTALAQQAAAIQNQFAEIATRLDLTGAGIRLAAGSGGGVNDGVSKRRSTTAYDGGDDDDDGGDDMTLERVAQEEAGSSRNTGTDWLPSRAANVPSFVAGIRPSSSSSSSSLRTTQQQPKRRPTASSSGYMGRNTLIGYQPVAYARKEVHEVLGSHGEPFPGDVDYEEEGEEGNEEQDAATGAMSSRSSSSAHHRRAHSAGAALREEEGGGERRAKHTGMGSPGVPMQVEHFSPNGRNIVPRTPAVGEAGIYNNNNNSITANNQSTRGGGKTLATRSATAATNSSSSSSPPSSAGSKSSGGSRSSGGGGPRRVPMTSPDAEPLFDPSVAARRAAAAFAEIGGTTTGEGSSSSSGSSTNAAANVSGSANLIGSPIAHSSNRSFGVRDQLAGLRDRVLELDRRAARLGGGTV